MLARVPDDERKKRVAKAAGLLGLTDQPKPKPKALSGGQRQRAALNRATVREEQVFCRDWVHKGDTIHVPTGPTNVHVFDVETGERIEG